MGKLFATAIEETGKRLCGLVGGLVGAHIAPLRKSLVADVTGVGLFAGMSPLMSLRKQVSSQLVRRKITPGVYLPSGFLVAKTAVRMRVPCRSTRPT